MLSNEKNCIIISFYDSFISYCNCTKTSGQWLQSYFAKRLEPYTGGKRLPLGDLPLNMAVSNSKKLMAVTNNGQSTQSIQLIDVPTGKILDNIEVAKCWVGLKFSADEKFLYASGGNDNWILKYAIQNHKLLLKDSLKLGKKWPEKISPAGIDIDDKRQSFICGYKR